MEQSTARADVQQLLEQMYNCLDKPDLNRARQSMRETLDHIAFSCMAQIEPACGDILWQGLRLSRHMRMIAEYLHARMGRVVRRETLYDMIWGGWGEEVDLPDPKVLDVYICKLRGVLTGSPFGIMTDYRVGYAMMPAGKCPERTPPAPKTKHPPQFWKGVRVGPDRKAILEFLETCPKTVHAAEVRDALFPGKPLQAVRVAICSAGAAIQTTGYRISNHWGVGYRMTGAPNGQA